MKIATRPITTIVLLLFLMLPLGVAAAPFVYYDVNGDGEVNIADVNALVDRIIKGGGPGDDIPQPQESTGFLSAADYGAVGDGVTDDTPALEALFADGFEKKLPIYIPEGTYMIRRPLTIKSGMEIYGDGVNTIIKKKAAVWSQLHRPTADGDTTLRLENVMGFNKGDHIFITNIASATNPTFTSARNCSFGEITAIDTVNKTITFVSAYEGMKTGTVKAHAKGCYVSTSFPIMRSWSSRDECIGVYIHDICLDGNRQEGEPMEWTNACIHFDPYSTIPRNGIYNTQHSYNHTIERCRLINASFDAISDQGEGGLFVKDCTIKNCAMHGIHMGTIFSGAVITGNKMTGNSIRGAGVFCCQSVTNVVVDDNEIAAFNHGCSDEEYGSSGKYLIIRNNWFRNIASSVFDFLNASNLAHGGGLQISENYIDGLNGPLFEGVYIDDAIIAKNQVRSITTTPNYFIDVTNSQNIVIVGNKITGDYNIPEIIHSTDTNNLINSSNSWNY